jgi:dimethylaniline monooxygenase (N-oxide forming)
MAMMKMLMNSRIAGAWPDVLMRPGAVAAVGYAPTHHSRHHQNIKSSRSSSFTTTTKTSFPFRQPQSNSTTALLMGCVCYDPAVYDIWSGFQQYLLGQGVPFDYILFTNYETQVRSLINGHVDVAWNGPIAHVMTEEWFFAATQDDDTTKLVSLGMRDVDRDFSSVVVVRKDANITTLDDLKDRTILTGASDSPQAHVVPLYHLKGQLQEEKMMMGQVVAFDVDVGMHGDTAVGEIQALQALLRTTTTPSATAAATTTTGDVALISKMMWDRAIQGHIPNVDAQLLQETCQELSRDILTIPRFDHCQLDAIETPQNTRKLHDFGAALLAMDINNPEQERIMKLEGIQQKWELPRQTGYDIVRRAMGITHLEQRHRTATNFQYHPKRHYSVSTTASATAAAAASAGTSTTSTAPPPPRRVAVIGAGVAGLQALRALKARGLNVTALEASPTVGGVWKENYANFGVQVPKQLYEFQDYPMTSGVKWGEYATGVQVQDYLERYTDAYGLRESIQFNTKVTSVQQEQDGINNINNKWKVNVTNTKDGSKDTLEFDYLVMARGLYSGSSQYIPSIPGQEAFTGEIVHSTDFCDAAVAKNKRVVVVGGGKSAVDCALEAYYGGGASSVTLLQRHAHWPTPRYIAGVIPFQYVFLSRFGTALVSAHRGTFPGGSGKAVNAFRNSVIGPALMRPVFALVEELFAFQFGLYGDLRPKEDVVSGFYKSALVLNSDLTKARKAGHVNVRLGEITKYGGDKKLLLKDGSSVDADLVVFATGFHQDYSIFSDPVTHQNLDIERDGMYLYRYMIPEKVPNLAFIGHVGAISNISSYGLQAEWLARNLTGCLVSGGTFMGTAPSLMHQEIEARKAWARSWMPESSYRGMMVLLHQTHYHDQLLRDMGLNPHRKSNVLAEYLMPYEPADYNGIMGVPPAKNKARDGA